MVEEAEESISRIKEPSEDEELGRITRVAGPVIEAENLRGVEMYEVVEIGEEGLIGEVIELEEDVATIQVYEETGGVKPGEPVKRTGEPLSLELGPGLIEQIYDGIQRPLKGLVEESGDFIGRGIEVSPLDNEKRWEFKPKVEEGEEVEQGDILGIVEETKTVDHKVMVPPNKDGKIKEIVSEGEYTIEETIAVLENEDGEEEISMKQRWPVRVGRPIKKKKQPGEILVTGQRVLDTFFPLAKGGTAAIPGGFGTGKCVTGETPVLLADGTKLPIKELYEKYESFGEKEANKKEELVRLNEPLEVLSMEDGKIAKKEANCLYKGKTDRTVVVKTKSGREVELTPVHKLFVLTPDLEIIEKPAGELKENDMLLVPRDLDIEGSKRKDKIIDVEKLLPEKRVCGKDFEKVIRAIKKLENEYKNRRTLANELGVSEEALIEYSLGRNQPKVKLSHKIFRKAGIDHKITQVKSERTSKSIKLPEKFDEDFAELLGLLMGDGSLKTTSVHFYNNDEALLKKVNELFDELFGLEGEREYANTVESVKVNCKTLRDLLVSLGFPEHDKSSRCSIPKKVLRGGEDTVAAFIRGYYLAAGGFNRYEIEIGTSSDKMASDLSYALTVLGTAPRISTKETDYSKHYRLRVSGEELDSFYQQTAVDHPKYEQIKEYLEKDSTNFKGVDSIDISPDLVQEKFEGSRINQERFKENGIKIENYTTQEEKMSIPLFKDFSDMLDDEELKSIAFNHLDHFLPDPVVSVEINDDTKDVYDLTVPDTHNFVGGNTPMLLHNTVIQHQLAKWSDADIVVYVGCGERGNEMTEVLRDFPELEDPWSGEPLMKRTVLIANTSNMPVAAREASVFSGITIAEYYRDMGYNVALMADSSSRWAEALREISGRLEEMPGEEGFPAYLATELASFYERAGICKLHGNREGSISVIGAVSPSGGDFSEPVTQNTLRIVQVFWALDTELKNRRHFPAVDWLTSYSLYLDEVSDWWEENVNKEWKNLRRETMRLLEKESELEEIVQLVGPDALPPSDQFALQAARMVREDFLQQNAFHDVDTFCSPEKQFRMLQIIMEYFETGKEAIEEGVTVDNLTGMDVIEEISRMSNIPSEEWDDEFNEIEMRMNDEFQELEESLELKSPVEDGTVLEEEG